MKINKLLTVCSSFSLALLLANTAGAVGLGDITGAANTLQKGSQALQAGQAVSAAAQGTGVGGGLTDVLIQQLGVNQTQATGGAGAIFQFAKSKMQEAAFTKVSNAVPGMSNLLAAAPVAKSGMGGGLGGMAGNLSSLAGNSGGTAGSVLGLAGSFQQLGLGPDMVQKFIPVVTQYVQNSGGSAVSGLLTSALMGGM